MRKRKPVPKPASGPASRPAPRPAPSPSPKPMADGDFIDTRRPDRQYHLDMIDYIDPSTGEITSRTRGVVPVRGGRFIPLKSYNPGKQVGSDYDAAFARQAYRNLLNQSIEQAQLFSDYIGRGMGVGDAITAATSGQAIGIMPQGNATTSATAGLAATLAGARNAANIQNQFQNYAQGVNNLMPVQSQPTMGTMQTIAGPQPIRGNPSTQQNAANINQAMQTYQNLFNQGAANYQAAMQQPISPAMRGPTPTQRKPSTSSFQTPRPFG